MEFVRIKYPLFLLGVLLMTVPALAYKYVSFSINLVIYSIVAGFVLFAISIISGAFSIRQ